jgi:endogenous inhibitor of DNA gyrase (YacG/DUF329 family)
MTEKYKIVACPTCGAEVAWLPENQWRPFCSQRCKLIDLGEWAAERYKLPVAEQDAPGEGEARG